MPGRKKLDRCRLCGRDGKVVPLPDGFIMPPDGPAELVLCQWHRAADTRRARELDAMGEELAEVQAACDAMLAENRRLLGKAEAEGEIHGREA